VSRDEIPKIANEQVRETRSSLERSCRALSLDFVRTDPICRITHETYGCNGGRREHLINGEKQRKGVTNEEWKAESY
jgi:hypothetical protein